jgi:hypothetical protein
MVPAMALALDANFGSVDRWRAEFVAMGKALGGGSGWVLLTFLPRDGTLVNQWAPTTRIRWQGGVPIPSASTCFEHALPPRLLCLCRAGVRSTPSLGQTSTGRAVYERDQDGRGMAASEAFRGGGRTTSRRASC